MLTHAAREGPWSGQPVHVNLSDALSDPHLKREGARGVQVVIVWLAAAKRQPRARFARCGSEAATPQNIGPQRQANSVVIVVAKSIGPSN